MPLPLLLAVPAVMSAIYGVKKGVDAYDDSSTAKENNKKAQKIYDDAIKRLENNKKKTNNSLEKLGFLKATIYDESLSDFMTIYEKIKNIDYTNQLTLGTLTNVDNQDILDIKSTVLEMKEILGGGIAALGGGALAGFGALGGVGAFASASTGATIAGLSGAAATNATLAWLGGGALSAGGFGMAGGMAVLGGIVAGPVLAVGGFFMASKASKAKHNSYSNIEKAKGIKVEIESASVVLNGIHKRVNEFIEVLEPLNKELKNHIIAMEYIVNKSTDYRSYSKLEKETIHISASIAKTVKDICDAPIIDENGEVTKKSKELLDSTKEFSQKIQKV